jgi:hypothetical protein
MCANSGDALAHRPKSCSDTQAHVALGRPLRGYSPGGVAGGPPCTACEALGVHRA